MLMRRDGRKKVLYCPGPGQEWELGEVSASDYADIEQVYINENNLFARQSEWVYRVFCRRKYKATVYPEGSRHALSGIMPISLLQGELPVNRHTPMSFWGYDFKSVTPYAGFQHQAIITGIAGAMAYAMLNSLSGKDYSNTQTFFIYLMVSWLTCFAACYLCHYSWGYAPEVMTSYTTVFTTNNACRQLMGEDPPANQKLCISFTTGEACPSCAYRLSFCYVYVLLPRSTSARGASGASGSSGLLI